MPSHSGSPYRAFAHCKVFAPAAPRRAWNLVSDSISGLWLSPPVPIIGTVGRYPTVYLIGRSHILWHRSISYSLHSSVGVLSVITLSFPRLSQSIGQFIYVLLSYSPRVLTRATSMAKSDPDSNDLWQDQPEFPDNQSGLTNTVLCPPFLKVDIFRGTDRDSPKLSKWEKKYLPSFVLCVNIRSCLYGIPQGQDPHLVLLRMTKLGPIISIG